MGQAAKTPADGYTILVVSNLFVVRMAELGYEPIGGTPEEFGKQIKLDLEKWSAVIRDARLKCASGFDINGSGLPAGRARRRDD